MMRFSHSQFSNQLLIILMQESVVTKFHINRGH